MVQSDANTNGDQLIPDTDKTMSGRCKWFICCGVSVVIVLAVMIPVGILVIAPKIGQAAIDMTTFHIINNTIFDIPSTSPITDCGDDDGCEFPNEVARGFVFGHVNIHSPMFIGAKLHEVNVSMVINMPGVASNNSSLPEGSRFDMLGFTDGPLAWFTMPASTITKGDNILQYGWNGSADSNVKNTTIYVNASKSAADGGFRMLSLGFAMYQSAVIYIDIVAEPKLTVLGFLTLQTKMKKTLACNCIPQKIDGGLTCVFPKTRPVDANFECEKNGTCPAYKPNTTYAGDDSFYSVGSYWKETNRSTGPPGAGSDDALPTLGIFCEPVDDDSVWDTYRGTKYTATTTTPAARLI